MLFAPVDEQWLHAPRLSRREQRADHILHTLWTQAFQDATLRVNSAVEVRKIVSLEPNAITSMIMMS